MCIYSFQVYVSSLPTLPFVPEQHRSGVMVAAAWDLLSLGWIGQVAQVVSARGRFSSAQDRALAASSSSAAVHSFIQNLPFLKSSEADFGPTLPVAERFVVVQHCQTAQILKYLGSNKILK